MVEEVRGGGLLWIGGYTNLLQMTGRPYRIELNYVAYSYKGEGRGTEDSVSSVVYTYQRGCRSEIL